MSINWDDLKFFLTVARDGTLAKAALRLGVTHSTVFRRINSFEDSIGMKLFSRVPEGYRLTNTGINVLKLVEKVSDDIDVLHRFIENSSNELSGRIQVTAPHNLAYAFLPRYIAEFRKKYPSIDISLMVSNSDYDLNRCEADLAIRATPSPPDTLIAHRLFILKWGAYASPDYVEKHGAPKSLDELQTHWLVSSYSDLFRLKAYRWIEDNISSDRIVSRCNDLISMSRVAEAGIGVALLPDDQIKPELVRLFTLPFDATSEIWVLIHPDMRDCQRLKVFREYIINAFTQDPLFQQCMQIE